MEVKLAWIRKHTSLLVFGLGGYLKASPVGEVLSSKSTYVVVGIAFNPHVAAVFTYVHFANDRDARTRPVDDES